MTERTLPAGWAWTTLGELCTPKYGKALSKEQRDDSADVPVVGSAGVMTHTDTALVADPCLVIGRKGNIGQVQLFDTPCWPIDTTFFVQPSACLDRKFLQYTLRAVDFGALNRSTTTPSLRREELESIPIPLPPLLEQHRIVDVLEDHLSRLDAAERALGSQLIRARELLDRQLASAVDEAGGTSVRVAEVLLRKPANGRSVPTADVGFPVLRLTALRDGVIDLAERKVGEWSAGDAEKFLVNRGDILISRGNGSLRLVGRAGIVHLDPDPVAYPDTMIRLVPDVNRVHPEYLVTLWNSRVVRGQIESAARTTAGIYKINQSIVSSILIPIPSLERQHRVVSEVGDVADAVRRLTVEIESGAARSAVLRRSLLRAAFNGELVDQDPTDQPADIALAAIRDQPSGTAPRPRRKVVA